MEFFCSPAALETVLSAVKAVPSIAYQAVNAKGEYQSNMAEDTVIAATWGVFPNQEIVQPTVVDVAAFKVWKDEAFALWTAGWASLYDGESQSQKLLAELKDTYYLVSLLDNNYVDGDLFKVFA
jgi:methylenetetrahydrofolate reductase (NADPH)